MALVREDLQELVGLAERQLEKLASLERSQYS